MRTPILIMTCVKAPKRPLLSGGETSATYIGQTTVEDPAPIPERKRPSIMISMLFANAEERGPKIKTNVVACMASSRPYLVATGPHMSAPKNPPTVKMDCTRPHWEGLIGIHCGRSNEP